MSMALYYTYIAFSSANKPHSIGVTNNIFRRFRLLNQRQENEQKGRCKLVYYEEFSSSNKATMRENELVSLPESLLRVLVEESNPMTVDLLNKEIIK